VPTQARAATAGKAKANTAVDARCRIELFGGMRLVQQDRTITRFRTHKAAHLLAYLALHRDQSHARERLTSCSGPRCRRGPGATI
jgi:two-component SAPR family response regulator